MIQPKMRKINKKTPSLFRISFKSIKLPVFVVILSLTSGIYWNLFNVRYIVSEWLKLPTYTISNVQNLFTPSALLKIEETRWNAFGDGREDLLSKVYYNKAYLILDKFFDYTTFLSPRFYFQAGDGTRFSPPGVEPIVGILFPFFVFGIIKLVKEKSWKLLFACLIFSLVAFLAGQKNLAYLLPVLIFYVYISTLTLRSKFALVVFVYCLYIVGRVIWLTS